MTLRTALLFMAVSWALPATLAFAPPAQGQTLRSVVVPGDAGIVVAPRGRLPPPLPRAALPPLASYVPAAPMAAAPVGMGLAATVPLLIPLAAAVLLGASSPGSSGGTAAPAATR